MIENNYYYFLCNNINLLEYIFFYSIITIQKPTNLFIYTNKELDGIYYDKLTNSKLWKKYKIKIEFKNVFDDFENILLKDINEYGGIYIKKNIFLLKNLKCFLIHDYIKLDNILYGINKNSNIKSIEDIYKNKKIFSLNDNVCYNLEDLKLFNKIIYDYNFTSYFNIVYNYYIIDINIDYNINIYENLKDNKITILNLIIYYILGYNYYFEINDIDDNFDIINKIDKIYYINLLDSKNRNNIMIKTLDKINIKYERYEGMNGKKILNIKNNYFENREILNLNTNSEYAVLYSHLSLINKLQYEYGKYFLIFEDDLSLDFKKYWDKSIKKIIDEAPDDWEIIMLGYFTLNLKFDNNYREWNNDWSALSYIIKKSSIKKINEYQINYKYKLFDDVNVADNYIFRIFKTYLYKYPLFTINNNNKSTFHNDHDHYQKIYKNINLLILNNVFDNYI